MKRHLKVRSVKWGLLWTSTVFLLASCGSVLPPQRTVYIPPEYQRPSPAAQPPVENTDRFGRVQPQPPPSERTSQGPLLQPAPDIMERDVASSSSQESPIPSEAIVPPPSVRPVEPKSEPRTAPQQLASTRIVDQAKASMNQGDVDHAISLLEQAIQVDVYNGDAFYGLAQAWRMKGAFDRALEFSNKAEVIYKSNPSKLKQLYLFEADVYTVLQEYEKAAAYREKASRL